MALKAYIDEYGIHIPSYPEVLDALKEELRGIYGQDVYLEPDSQEGALCAVFALRLYDCYTRDKYGSPALIRFFRPGIDSAAVFIRIRPLDGYVATTGQTVRRNAAEYINSLPIGESVLLSKLYTPINTAEPDPARRTFDVLEIRLGPKGGALTAANMLVAFNHAAACSLDDVALQEY